MSTRVKLSTRTVGDYFATCGVILDAETQEVLTWCDTDRPYGMTEPALEDARRLATELGLKIDCDDDLTVVRNGDDERCIASMGRVEAHALVAACGTRLVLDTDGPGLVTDCALSRDVARRLVSDLREAGYEADDAPDGDDPAFAWVYVRMDGDRVG